MPSVAAAALFAALLVADAPVVVVAIAALVAYLALLSGAWVVPAPADRPKKPKVFCIGLSRTGTSSITVALQRLGYAAHHQCHALALRNGRASRFWADAFDAHADIAPATVFEDLATRYPDAKFVLTTREEGAWAKAMVRFCGKFRHNFFGMVASLMVVHMVFDTEKDCWNAKFDKRPLVTSSHPIRVLIFNNG